MTPARGLVRAVKILTSRSAGADDGPRVRSWLAQGLWLSALVGTVLAGLAPAGPWLFATLGTSEGVARHAADYLSHAHAGDRRGQRAQRAAGPLVPVRR